MANAFCKMECFHVMGKLYYNHFKKLLFPQVLIANTNIKSIIHKYITNIS